MKSWLETWPIVSSSAQKPQTIAVNCMWRETVCTVDKFVCLDIRSTSNTSV